MGFGSFKEVWGSLTGVSAPLKELGLLQWVWASYTGVWTPSRGFGVDIRFRVDLWISNIGAQ